jgi:hypothetical protein
MANAHSKAPAVASSSAVHQLTCGLPALAALRK